jgi:hypothetical protein
MLGRVIDQSNNQLTYSIGGLAFTTVLTGEGRTRIIRAWFAVGLFAGPNTTI